MLYCTTIAPFDVETLQATYQGNDVILYAKASIADIAAVMRHKRVRIDAIGVSHEILGRYGTPEQHDETTGLTPHGIR